jgi:hypothetical protein
LCVRAWPRLSTTQHQNLWRVHEPSPANGGGHGLRTNPRAMQRRRRRRCRSPHPAQPFLRPSSLHGAAGQDEGVTACLPRGGHHGPWKSERTPEVRKPSTRKHCREVSGLTCTLGPLCCAPCCAVLFHVPSSCPPMRAFSILNDCIDDNQCSALAV